MTSSAPPSRPTAIAPDAAVAAPAAPAASTPPVDLAAAIQNSNSGHRRAWILGIILVVAILSVAAWFWWRKAEQARTRLPPYATESLQRGDITLTITATGNLVPTNEVTVGSELSGTTLEVLADINDRVTQGQVLARLDTTKLAQQTASSRAAVLVAKAQVNQAQATREETDAALARQQELRRLSGGRVPSQLELAAAEAASARAHATLLSAEAGVVQAEAQVKINESDLAKAVIKSPIDGMVLTRSIEPGQTVAASFTAPQLFVIAENLEHMKLEVDIAEADIGRVAKGQTAVFTVDAWPDRAYTARVLVVAFGSAVTNNVVTYQADLEVTNTDLSLRPGMTATADLQVAEARDVWLVPTAALRFVPASASTAAAAPKKSFVQSLIPSISRRSQTDPGAAAKPAVADAHVWVLRNGKPEAISVKLGLSDGRFTEISGAGLEAGLAIILRANTPSP